MIKIQDSFACNLTIIMDEKIFSTLGALYLILSLLVRYVQILLRLVEIYM